MEIDTIFIYCPADAITRASGMQDKHRSKMTNAEIITFVMISALFYQCNYKLTRLISLHCRFFASCLSHSRLNRRIHQVLREIWLMMFTIFQNFNTKSNEFIVDSFPVTCCQNYKRFRCRLFPGKKFHGYTASKKQYFFGIKVHMVISAEGIPIAFVFTPGAEADIPGLHRLNFDLPKGSMLFADEAYTDYELEDFLRNEDKCEKEACSL